jgi:uncharacterized protein (DUF433 family)
MGVSICRGTIHHEFLTIDLEPFVRGVVNQLDKLVAARKMVISSSDYLGGTPVIRGTRVPVYDIAASAASGISSERILAAYPSLDAQQIELAKMCRRLPEIHGQDPSAARRA